jgi:hypothetical protein
MIDSSVRAARKGGQGRDRTADLPLFRMKDDRPGLTMMVYLACSGPAVDGDGRRYTNMYETRNATNRRLVTCHKKRVLTS